VLGKLLLRISTKRNFLISLH